LADEIIGFDEWGLSCEMIVDSSALVAILTSEPERELF